MLSRARLLEAAKAFTEAAPEPRAVALEDGPVQDAGAPIVAALGPCPEDGLRSEAAFALAGVLRRLGATRSTFAAVVRAWFTESRNVEDHVRRGGTAWTHDGDVVSGPERLEAVLGVNRAGMVLAVAGAALAPRRHAPDLAPVEVKERGVGVLGALVDPTDQSDLELPYICKALGLMPYRGKVTLFAGLHGAAKGPTADHVALCVVTGAPIFGTFEVERPCPVLILDFEGAVGTKRRLRRMCADAGVEWPADLHVIEADPLMVDSLEWLEDLGDFIEHAGVGMVIIDSYTSAALAGGADTNKPEFAKLAQRLGTLGVCVICVAHAAKASSGKDALSLTDVAGSMALAAMSVVAWGFREVGKYRVEVSCLRTFEGAPFEPIDLLWTDTHDGAGLHVETSTRAAPVSKATVARVEKARELKAQALDLRAKVREWVLGHPQEAWTVHALEAVLPASRGAIKGACIELVAHGELSTENHGTVTSPRLAYVPPREPEPSAVSTFRGS